MSKTKFIGISEGNSYPVYERDKQYPLIGRTELPGYFNGPVWCTFERIVEVKRYAIEERGPSGVPSLVWVRASSPEAALTIARLRNFISAPVIGYRACLALVAGRTFKVLKA